MKRTSSLTAARPLVALVALAAIVFASATASEAGIRVDSPDGRVRATVFVDREGQLSWRVTFRGRPIVLDSPLGLRLSSAVLGRDVQVREKTGGERRRTYPVRGHHRRAVDHHRWRVIAVRDARAERNFEVHLRVYDEGVALRYRLPNEQRYRIAGELTEWRLPQGGTAYLQDSDGQYRARYADDGVDAQGHDQPAPGAHQRIYQAMYFDTPIEKLIPGSVIGPPMLVDLAGDGGYVWIAEGNLVDYMGMRFEALGRRALTVNYQFDPDADHRRSVQQGPVTTPWRLAAVAGDLNGIVNTDLPAHVCPPPDEALRDAAWIEPGHAAWSWYAEDTGGLEQQRRYVDRAAELDFSYNLVDWRWDKNFGEDHWSKLVGLVRYARRKGVRLWIWWHSERLRDPARREAFFDRCAEAGVAGVKIDFFQSEHKDEIGYYHTLLRAAAERELMVNFHGCTKPTGRQRTWPNEMTREAVRANEWHTTDWGGGRTLSPSHNVIVPFTRDVLGNTDFTPVIFDPEELRGFTRAHQLAQAICYTSPLTHWCDRPRFYLESAATDLIRSLPTVWDETVVLEATDLGEVAAIARRRNETWFVGVMNGGAARRLDLALGFLDADRYSAVLLGDTEGKPARLNRSEVTVTADRTLPVTMEQSGGFVARFRPMNR